MQVIKFNAREAGLRNCRLFAGQANSDVERQKVGENY